MGSTRAAARGWCGILLLAGLLQGCTAPCPTGLSRAAGLTLYFGGSLSDADWAAFAASRLTPAFPHGLTVFEAAGQWRDPSGGRIVRERTRVVQVFGTDIGARADSVISAYRAAYHQVSVGRVENTVCAAF